MDTSIGSAPAVVEFDDESTGSAPMTWGQRNMRRACSENPPGFFNLSRVITPPKRARLEPAQWAGALAALVRRHESLRTVYPVGPAGPRQQVRGSGRLELAQVDGGDDPTAAAERLRAELAGPGFDDARDLPLRVGVVTTAGTVARIVLALSHLAADQTAVDILERELRLLALRGRLSAPAGPQPRDLAAREQADGRRLIEAAFAHWDGLYRRMPPAMFDVEGPAHDPLCQRVRLRSRALPPALRLLAGAHQVSSGTVLLAAAATAVARFTGHDTIAIGTLVGNRFQSGHQNVVTSLVQLGLFGLDRVREGAGGPPELTDLIAPAWQAAMRTYRHAYYDPDEIWSRLDQVSIDRGRRIDPYCCFNDLRVAPDLLTPAAPGAVGADGATDTSGATGTGPEALRAAAAAAIPHTTLLDEASIRPMHCRFCLQVVDEPGGIALRLAADTRYLPPAEMRRFLRETERLVLAAAGVPEGGS